MLIFYGTIVYRLSLQQHKCLKEERALGKLWLNTIEPLRCVFLTAKLAPTKKPHSCHLCLGKDSRGGHEKVKSNEVQDVRSERTTFNDELQKSSL